MLLTDVAYTRFTKGVDHGQVAYCAYFSSTRPGQLPMTLNSFMSLRAEGRTRALLFPRVKICRSCMLGFRISRPASY